MSSEEISQFRKARIEDRKKKAEVSEKFIENAGVQAQSADNTATNDTALTIYWGIQSNLSAQKALMMRVDRLDSHLQDVIRNVISNCA